MVAHTGDRKHSQIPQSSPHPSVCHCCHPELGDNNTPCRDGEWQCQLQGVTQV